MGDVSLPPNTQDVFLLPEHIDTREEFIKLRQNINEEEEAELIEALAGLIERDGQLDSAILIPAKKKDDPFILYAGHRRRRAIALINEKRSRTPGAELMRLRCRIDNSGGDIKRKAITSNLGREGFTALDLAAIIRDLRVEHSWEGFPGTKKISAYLGISPAQVTQHEKLLSATPEIRQALLEKRMTVQGAYDMLNVKPEKQSEVIKKAEELQRVRNQKLTPRIRAAREAKGIKDEAVESPQVRRAIRETSGASTKPIPLTRKELLEELTAFDSSAYGHVDGAIREWVGYFTGAFAEGAGTTTTMRKKFDAMTSKAPKGSKPEPEPEEPKKPAKKKEAKKEAKPKEPAQKKPAKKKSKKSEAPVE